MIGSQPEENMEYNTSRPRMIIPEYGRNVQKMVDYLLTIEDREERNKQARNLIAIIANLNPQVYETDDDPEHKLWDHLYIMSDFKLNVDSPYPPPAPESLLEKPKPVEYPDTTRRNRHYGNIVRNMIDYAVKLEEGEEKQALTKSVANLMKKHYLVWNKNHVEDQVILDNLSQMSDGKLDIKGLNLAEKRDLVQNHPNNNNNHKKKGRGRSKRKSNKKK